MTWTNEERERVKDSILFLEFKMDTFTKISNEGENTFGMVFWRINVTIHSKKNVHVIT